MNHYIDTHCHIHMMPADMQAGALERARTAGVKKLMNVSCSLEETAACLALTEDEFIWTTSGIHPTDLSDDMETDLKKVYEFAKNTPKVVAIGEMGIDYYHDKFPRQQQLDYFVGHLDIAKELDLPAIIHTRAGKYAGDNVAAFRDVINTLKTEQFSNAVSHCFSGDMAEAKELLSMGVYLSFTGIVTYERNQELRDIIKMAPLDQILIETDSPYLTPQQHRGKKNEPAFVVEVAKVIADSKGISLEEVAAATTANAERFFKI